MDEMLLRVAMDAITVEIEKDSNNANLFRERGRLRFQLGMEREAMEDLRQAIALNPELVDEIANGQFEGKIDSCH